MSRLRPTLTLVALLLLALLAACGGDPVPLAVDEPAVIDCTDECADRGQCGRLVDDRLAALGHSAGPAVTGHDRFFVHETAVVVREVSERQLVGASSGIPLEGATPFPHLFYRVEGEGKNAWVSEWCVARP
jgi:hypothetical protein